MKRRWWWWGHFCTISPAKEKLQWDRGIRHRGGLPLLVEKGNTSRASEHCLLQDPLMGSEGLSPGWQPFSLPHSGALRPLSTANLRGSCGVCRLCSLGASTGLFLTGPEAVGEGVRMSCLSPFFILKPMTSAQDSGAFSQRKPSSELTSTGREPGVKQVGTLGLAPWRSHRCSGSGSSVVKVQIQCSVVLPQWRSFCSKKELRKVKCFAWAKAIAIRSSCLSFSLSSALRLATLCCSPD